MKKTLLGLFVLLICCFVSACRVKETYDFLNATDEISDISIVAISFDENDEVIQTEIRKIDNISAFLDDFKAVSCYIYFGDPTGVVSEGKEDTVIKITYQNGEYELINWKGQAEDTLEKDFNFYAGFSVFDEEQFEALITKYTLN
jgi:hypothetical protein